MPLHAKSKPHRTIHPVAAEMGDAMLRIFIQHGTDRAVEESDLRGLGFSAEEITAHRHDARAHARQTYDAQIKDIAA